MDKPHTPTLTKEMLEMGRKQLWANAANAQPLRVHCPVCFAVVQDAEELVRCMNRHASASQNPGKP